MGTGDYFMKKLIYLFILAGVNRKSRNVRPFQPVFRNFSGGRIFSLCGPQKALGFPLHPINHGFSWVFAHVRITVHVWVPIVQYIWSKPTFLRKIEKFRKFPVFSRITRFASPSSLGAIPTAIPSKIDEKHKNRLYSLVGIPIEITVSPPRPVFKKL